MSVMAFDELNTMQAKEETEKLFERLLAFNEKEYRKIARQAAQYALSFLPNENKNKRFDEAVAVALILAAYNPVTGYLYKSEAERKRLRLSEEMLTAREFLDRGRYEAAVKKAANLWYTQSMQYAIDIEDGTVLDVWRDCDVKQVRWVAEDDGRTCSKCRELNGQVFKINEVPPKQHYNCRCYCVPVK